MQVGDEGEYRAISGGRYPAKVTGIGPDGFVDLAVDVGTKDRWPLRAIRVDRFVSDQSTDG